MKYCKKCLDPSTRPKITFNSNGICSSCEFATNNKTSTDDNFKEKVFREIFVNLKRKKLTF